MAKLLASKYPLAVLEVSCQKVDSEKVFAGLE